MSNWVRFIVLVLEGLSSITESFQRDKHEKNKQNQVDDPVSTFNDKFGGVSDDTTSPVSNNQAHNPSLGERDRER